MNVALKHHYGWRIYSVDAPTLAAAAYAAVRLSHTFLTDSNHTHQEGPQVLQWGGKTYAYNAVTIAKNDTSPRFALAPAWVQDGAGAYWFGVEYREPATSDLCARAA